MRYQGAGSSLTDMKVKITGTSGWTGAYSVGMRLPKYLENVQIPTTDPEVFEDDGAQQFICHYT